MQLFSARGFFWAGQYIENLRNECYILSLGDGDVPRFDMMTPLDDRARKKTFELLKVVEEQCDSIGLSISSQTARDLRDESQTDTPGQNVQWLLDQLRSLRKLIEREMKGKIIHLPTTERAKFLTKLSEPYPFGKDVNESFPSAQYDSVEATCSLAFIRPTAAVFHLMRIMEIALAALGAEFGISLAHTNWAPAIDEIEKKIRNMNQDSAWKAKPDYKLIQEGYSQAISTFGVLKDAWRNYTMHVRGKYTDEEAEHLFNNTKFFMQRLTALGLKETP